MNNRKFVVEVNNLSVKYGNFFAVETIEVKSGIKSSDKVVTKGQTYLDDGSKVKVVSDNGTEITEATTEATTENPKAKKSKGENK